MATPFTLAIATLKSAYDTYLSTNATITAAKAAIVIADSDWNNYVTANEAWIANNTTLQATLASCTHNTRIAELAVIALFGYNTGSIPDSIAYDEWIKVVGAGGGILTYTHWIGFSINSTYLTISTVQPTQAFPNL